MLSVSDIGKSFRRFHRPAFESEGFLAVFMRGEVDGVIQAKR